MKEVNKFAIISIIIFSSLSSEARESNSHSDNISTDAQALAITDITPEDINWEAQHAKDDRTENNAIPGNTHKKIYKNYNLNEASNEGGVVQTQPLSESGDDVLASAGQNSWDSDEPASNVRGNVGRADGNINNIEPAAGGDVASGGSAGNEKASGNAGNNSGIYSGIFQPNPSAMQRPDPDKVQRPDSAKVQSPDPNNMQRPNPDSVKRPVIVETAPLFKFKQDGELKDNPYVVNGREYHYYNYKSTDSLNCPPGKLKTKECP